jgi:hypothetical protein
MIADFLLIVSAFVWLMFFVGYPVYTKFIKREKCDWLWWAIWVNVLSLVVNIINIFR